MIAVYLRRPLGKQAKQTLHSNYLTFGMCRVSPPMGYCTLGPESGRANAKVDPRASSTSLLA